MITMTLSVIRDFIAQCGIRIQLSIIANEILSLRVWISSSVKAFSRLCSKLLQRKRVILKTLEISFLSSVIINTPFHDIGFFVYVF